MTDPTAHQPLTLEQFGDIAIYDLRGFLTDSRLREYHTGQTWLKPLDDWYRDLDDYIAEHGSGKDPDHDQNG